MLQAARENLLEMIRGLAYGYHPQFVAREFKEFIRVAGMTHVRTSPHSPQSNGKTEVNSVSASRIDSRKLGVTSSKLYDWRPR